MKDKERILQIEHDWMDADHGSQQQSLWGPDMRFLLDYIKDLELPVSTGSREIEKLKGIIGGLEYRLSSSKDMYKDSLDHNKVLQTTIENIRRTQTVNEVFNMEALIYYYLKNEGHTE